MSRAAWLCPVCNAETLTPHGRVAADTDPRWDEDRVWIRCDTCDARYIAHVTEYVNVVADTDSITNNAHHCEAAEWDRTLAVAKRCPRPGECGCPCPAHKTIPKLGASAWYRS